MTSTRATDPYFFPHMCISFPVIVSKSNKTADATCPRRKTKANKFRATRRHTSKPRVSPEKMAYKAEAIRYRENQLIKLTKTRSKK